MRIFDYYNRFKRLESDYNRKNEIGDIYHIIINYIRYGASIKDNYIYEFWNKSNAEKKTYITCKWHKWLQHLVNDNNDIEILRDKRKFNDYYRDEINREWHEVSRLTIEEFCDFCSRHESFFIKPYDGCEAHGVRKIVTEKVENKVILYNSLKNEEKCIIEETVKQEGLLHFLNPSSVNCFRIMTFRKDKASPARVLSVVLRIGRDGNNMDNLAGGGLVGNVDLVTGKISDCLYDIYLNKYVVHPDSKMKLSGLQIPEFDKIKRFALMLADKIATVGYIGWDIVYSDGKLTVIEGNDCADHDVYQIAAQRGMLKDFCNIVKGEEYAIL